MKRIFTCIFILVLCLYSAPAGPSEMAKFSLNITVMAAEEIPTKIDYASISAYTMDNITNDSSKKAPDYDSMLDNQALASTVHNPITLRATEELSDTIVKGTFLGVTKQAELWDDELEFFRYAVICSSIRVDEVYSGDVQVGDILHLFEPYFIAKSEGQTVLNHFENYYPSENGRTYIWLLKKSLGSEFDPGFHFEPDQIYYSLAWCERGRYPVLNDNARSASDISAMSSRDLDLSPNGDTTVYKKIYGEVIDKYLKK